LSSVAGLDAAVERCVAVKHGIAGQYVYRGLYAAQLFHCHKSVPQDKVLVLDSAALRRSPRQAMALVHAHLGIADYAYPTILSGSTKEQKEQQQEQGDGSGYSDDGRSSSSSSSGSSSSGGDRSGDKHEPLFAGEDAAERLKSAFDAFYPSFESRTGWRMQGDYERMPRDMEAALRRFYAPFNGMLFGMLGRSFDWD
jgi:hypothetical protein